MASEKHSDTAKEGGHQATAHRPLFPQRHAFPIGAVVTLTKGFDAKYAASIISYDPERCSFACDILDTPSAVGERANAFSGQLRFDSFVAPTTSLVAPDGLSIDAESGAGVALRTLRPHTSGATIFSEPPFAIIRGSVQDEDSRDFVSMLENAWAAYTGAQQQHDPLKSTLAAFDALGGGDDARRVCSVLMAKARVVAEEERWFTRGPIPAVHRRLLRSPENGHDADVTSVLSRVLTNCHYCRLCGVKEDAVCLSRGSNSVRLEEPLLFLRCFV
jgi:hypothetical protein